MTSSSTVYDIAIVGGGLAGWALAHMLVHQQGRDPSTLIIFDDHDPLKASDAPGALLHALPGRSLAFKSDAADAFETSSRWLDALMRKYPDVIRRHDEIVRLLKPGKIGRRYKNTYERGRETYPSMMTDRLLSREDVQAIYPQLAPFDGAICYGPAYMVGLPGLLAALRDELGVQVVDQRVLALEHQPTYPSPVWRMTTQTSDYIAKQIVLCAGTGLARWFPNLDISINGGELMTIMPAPDDDHDAFGGVVSAGGHLGTMSDGRWVLGATYLRTENDPYDPSSWARPDDDARAALTTLIGAIVPALHHQRDGAIWRGTRAVCQPARLPLAGRVPGAETLFVLGALGSKGLLWAPSLAKTLARALFEPDVEFPQSVALDHRAPHSNTWQLDHD